MNILLRSALTLALLAPTAPAPDQQPRPPKSKPAEAKPAATKSKSAGVNDDPVVTRHEIRIGGRPLKYTATAGYLPIKDEKGEAEAHIFFVAYSKDDAGERSKRPLTFSFNGGP